MRRLRRGAVLALVGVSLAMTTISPAVARAGDSPPPSEPCVPGTTYEDPLSGVSWLCIYDEIYGGPRWDVLPVPDQRSVEGWLYRSSAYGCLFGNTGITARGGSGADAVMRTYRWPCRGAADRMSQPATEIRSRVVIQVYASGWTTCRDSGYRYNSVTATGWLAAFDMGSAADCGTGSYRAWGFGGFYQGGAWRTGSHLTTSLPLR
jgi:hypothetical protein